MKKKYCHVRRLKKNKCIPQDVDEDRKQAIMTNTKYWPNGTKLLYCFIPNVNFTDKKNETYKKAVRNSFNTWKNVGIGLSFEETTNIHDSDLRIAFDVGDGSWSYVGTDNDRIERYDPKNPTLPQKTMNLGWDISKPEYFYTTIHEIGHVLGLEHEHQNPNSGIVWNKEQVYANFEREQGWSKDLIDENVIKKLDKANFINFGCKADGTCDPSNTKYTGEEYEGLAVWDKNSIMEYSFDAGLIDKPEEYQKIPLNPPGTISKKDKAVVRTIYPPQKSSIKKLYPFITINLDLDIGEQFDIRIKPKSTNISIIETNGKADTVMYLYNNDKLLAKDDDSGFERNAKITRNLVAGCLYLLKVRVIYKKKDDKLTLTWRCT
jgi:hypothetical protein